jgi:hypothetical protein
VRQWQFESAIVEGRPRPVGPVLPDRRLSRRS